MRRTQGLPFTCPRRSSDPPYSSQSSHWTPSGPGLPRTVTWSGWIYTNCNKLWAMASEFPCQAPGLCRLPGPPACPSRALTPVPACRRAPQFQRGRDLPSTVTSPGPRQGQAGLRRPGLCVPGAGNPLGLDPAAGFPPPPADPTGSSLPSILRLSTSRSCRSWRGGGCLLPVRPVLISPRAAVNHASQASGSC